MAHKAGYGGNLYALSSVVEDCEDAWTTGGAGRTTSTTTGKVGTYSARVATTTIGATTLLSYEDFGATDLSDYDALVLWIRSSINTSAGDLQILLDDTSACVSALESLNLPALVANTWTRVLLRFATPANLTAIISIGLYQVADLADGNFDLDDIRAVKQVDGVRNWSINSSVETPDVTDFGSSGNREFLVGLQGWSASWEGLKDGVPMTEFGSEAVVAFQEGTTVGEAWIGNAIITGLSTTAGIDNVVTYSYTGQGTGELQLAVA